MVLHGFRIQCRTLVYLLLRIETKPSMENSNEKINDPVFSDERALARWIARSRLSVGDHDHEGNPVLDLVNKPIHLHKFYNDYKKKFPNEIYPTEFDIIITGGISYPNKDKNKFFEYDGYTDLYVVELKYFRQKLNKKGKKVSKPSRYNEGIQQCIANLNFGFEEVHLWHFFDPNFPKEKIEIFKEQMTKDLGNLQIRIKGDKQIPLPISYSIYRIEDEGNKKNFDKTKLESLNGWIKNPLSSEKAQNMEFIHEYIMKIRKNKSYIMD